MFFVVLLASCSNRTEIFVSPEGNDNNSGTKDQPVASLQKAADLIRDKTGKRSVTIFLKGGVYHLTQPLHLTEQESGTKDLPVVWKTLPGEKVVISGGTEVRNWHEESEGLWSAELPDELNMKFRSFYVNGKRAVRARTPDDGFLRVKQAGEDNKTNFYFNNDDIPAISRVEDVEIVFLHDWSISRVGVKSIDRKTGHLTAKDPIGALQLKFFTISNWEKHPRYFLENAMEFCNSPGEWYCDFDARKIFYRPLAGEKPETSVGVIPVAEKLLTIKGSENKHAAFMRFEGIVFENTEWLLPEKGYCGVQACMYDNRVDRNPGWKQVPAAIELDIADNIVFKDCVIRHTGGSGLWIRENCTGCVVESSHIYDIAGNGVNIGEGRYRQVNGRSWWEAEPDQVSKNNRIANSLVEDCGKQFYGAVGVWGGLVEKTVIERNEIRDLPYTGVSIGWMWDTIPTPCRENTITGNHIHHVMNILSDGGGIYSLGLQPHSMISNNLIHDVTVNAGRAESNGMFLDEGTKDMVVENNIIYNIAKSPLRFHRAFHNVVRNNVFVCGDGIPPIRYNSTKEDNIVKIDNTVLKQASDDDLKQLENIVDNRKPDIGPDNLSWK